MTQPHDPNSPPHAWVLAGYTTAQIRNVARELQGNMSKIEVPGVKRRTDHDDMLMKAVQALAVCADHIDRLHGDMGPNIVALATAMDPEGMVLFGTDTMGLTWQYSFEDGGWLRMSNAVVKVSIHDAKMPGDEGGDHAEN